jgi:hypothetical protein
MVLGAKVMATVCSALMSVAVCARGAASGEKGKPTTGQAALALADNVSEYGITWRFSKKVRVGRFVNGDYYVVGPVTVVSITPAPENDRNGSVLNLPPLNDRSGFDSRVEANRYDPSLRANPPVHMKPGDALVSTISVDKMRELPAPLRPSDKAISPVRSASVLTCLPAPAPRDAFRPSYCDRRQTIYLARNLRRDLLPKLPRVKSTPDLREWADRFQRPWLDVCFFGFDAPIEYMPHYGREIARAVGIASLMLMLDWPQEQQAERERLLINFVQYGIDLWGIAQAGYPGWPAHGGHGSGRKWPIVFAGMILGDKDMQSPKSKYPGLKFGEDMQTIHGNGWTGAKALYAGHVGEDGEKVAKGWGAYEHLPPSQWPGLLGESYRRCCTSIAWVGEALAARLMRAERVWDHDAFFDYVDRWMTEDDTEALKAIKEATGHDFSADWSRQRQTWDPFVMEMWARYR